MKQKLFLIPLISLLICSCSTYQHTSRQAYVKQKNIDRKEQCAEIIVDYSKKITATSDYQTTRKDAKKEAEYKCLQLANADVIVDPIYQIETNLFKMFKKYKATVVGFAGMYKNSPAGVDATKQHNREEIENYKLLTDPEFYKYFYGNGTSEGDVYNFNSSTEGSAKFTTREYGNLLSKSPAVNTKKLFDYRESLKLRNAGIWTTASGILSTFLIGIPCMYAPPYRRYVDEYGYTVDYRMTYSREIGMFFVTAGSALTVTGVTLWSIGSYRMKHGDNTADLALTTTGTGLGLKLNF